MSREDHTVLLHNAAESFGSYVFLKRLAAGGMAEVFLARPASLDGNGRVQVVKRILPHVANDSMFLNMFQAEIQVILGFNHPHTVQLHDFGTINRQPYIAMEYIEGKNLKEVINKFKSKEEPMPIAMILSLMSQAASGLSYAHTFTNKVTGEVVNAIHRDISPQNLMVTYEGNLKVIDFGIAKAASGMQEATRAGTIKGKMAYLSPEQISGKPVDARSDVFALGIVAWELLTLTRAFIKEGDGEFTVIARIDNCEKNILPPSSINKEIPPELDELVMKALKKNPDERFASARDFQIALRHVMVKHYPEYSYSDTGLMISSLFEKEIEAERKELRELNVKAQKQIMDQLEAETLIPEDMRPVLPGKRPQAMEHVDNRLKQIEAMMKQKASGRHYMMLAFYIFAVFALQLEGKYSIFSWIIPVDDEVEIAQVEKAAVKNQARATTPKKRKAASVAPSQSRVSKKNTPPKVANKGSSQGTTKR